MLERDGVCLAPQRTKQPFDNPFNNLKVPLPRLIKSSRYSARVLNDYHRDNRDMHIYMRRGVADDRKGLCAALQRPSVDIDQSAPWLQVALDGAQLDGSRMNKSVLVLIPSVVHKPECPMLDTATMWIRLQPLDECMWTITDASQGEHPTTEGETGGVPRLGLSRFVKPGPVCENRKSRLRQPSAAPVKGQLINGMIKSRSQVVDRFTEDNSPLWRKGRIDREMEHMLCAIRIRLAGKSIGVGLERVEGFDMGTKTIQVLLRTRDFGSDSGDGVTVRPHTVGSQHAAGRRGRPADSRNASGLHDPGAQP